jgi:hypothetical protein
MVSRSTVSRALFSEMKEVMIRQVCNLVKNIKIMDKFGGDTPLKGASCFTDIMHEYFPFEDR